MPTSPEPTSKRIYFAIVDLPAARRFQRMLEGRGVWLRRCHPSELRTILHADTAGGLILDPGLITDEETEYAAATLIRIPRNVTIYVPLEPAAIARSIELSRRTTAAVIFQGFDETPAVLARAILASPPPALVRAFLGRLREQLDKLPPLLHASIHELFYDATRGTSPDALARRVGLTRRSCDRWLVRVGIPAPRLLLIAPSVLQALALLTDTNYSRRSVATISGFQSLRQLDTHCRALLGFSSAHLRDPSISDFAVDTIATTVIAGHSLSHERRSCES